MFGHAGESLRYNVFGVAAPPDGLWSIPFIAPSALPGNPSG